MNAPITDFRMYFIGVHVNELSLAQVMKRSVGVQANEFTMNRVLGRGSCK